MNYHQPSLMHAACINIIENPCKSTSLEPSSYSRKKALVTFIDRPCGTGKTTELLRSFEEGKNYLVVVPFLSEVERVLKDACVPFTQPSDTDGKTKTIHFEELLQAKSNIAITHSLFTQLGFAGRTGLLEDYHVIIDEVLDMVSQESFCSAESFKDVYIKAGFATVGNDGAVHPSLEWWQKRDDLADTLSRKHFHMAQAGTLYKSPAGGFVRAMPLTLLTEALSVTVYTYMAEGSLMVAYLKKKGIAYHIEKWDGETEWGKRVGALVNVKTIKALQKIAFSHNKQISSEGKKQRDKKVANALSNTWQRELRDVSIEDVLITCAKSNWQDDSKGKTKHVGFAKGSRMQGAHWVANTTRGTNMYAHTSVCIYLYDQHPNITVARWLGIDNREAKDRYALSELIQWVFRSRVRKGEPITLYLPSKRMRRLWSVLLDKRA